MIDTNPHAERKYCKEHLPLSIVYALTHWVQRKDAPTHERHTERRWGASDGFHSGTKQALKPLDRLGIAEDVHRQRQWLTDATPPFAATSSLLKKSDASDISGRSQPAPPPSVALKPDLRVASSDATCRSRRFTAAFVI